MKFNYFHSKESKFGVTAIGIGLTAALAKIAPRFSSLLGRKLLLKPYGKRRYQFTLEVAHREINLMTSMGTAHVNLFGSGNNVIILTHGWGDNSLSFEHLIKSLTQQGYMVAALDHIGHGKSAGNKAHLLAFIETMEILLEHFQHERIPVSGIIGHSMGAIATLNLPTNSLQDKKIILISSPIKFFELMFEKVEQVGISRRLLVRVLEHIGGLYGKNWQHLRSEHHKEKLSLDVTFIHDKGDRYAPYSDLKHFLQNEEQLIATEGLGHRKILGDTMVINSISQVLVS